MGDKHPQPIVFLSARKNLPHGDKEWSDPLHLHDKNHCGVSRREGAGRGAGTGKVTLENTQQVLQEQRAVFLAGEHKNTNINVGLPFSFSDDIIFLSENRSKLIIKLFLLKCSFFSCYKNEEVNRYVFLFD